MTTPSTSDIAVKEWVDDEAALASLAEADEAATRIVEDADRQAQDVDADAFEAQVPGSAAHSVGVIRLQPRYDRPMHRDAKSSVQSNRCHVTFVT